MEGHLLQIALDTQEKSLTEVIPHKEKMTGFKVVTANLEQAETERATASTANVKED